MDKLDEWDNSHHKLQGGHILKYLFSFGVLNIWGMPVADRLAQHEAIKPGAISWGNVCAEPEELMACTFLLEP